MICNSKGMSFANSVIFPPYFGQKASPQTVFKKCNESIPLSSLLGAKVRGGIQWLAVFEVWPRGGASAWEVQGTPQPTHPTPLTACLKPLVLSKAYSTFGPPTSQEGGFGAETPVIPWHLPANPPPATTRCHEPALPLAWCHEPSYSLPFGNPPFIRFPPYQYCFLFFSFPFLFYFSSPLHTLAHRVENLWFRWAQRWFFLRVKSFLGWIPSHLYPPQPAI